MPAHDHCCVLNCSNRRDKCPGLLFHRLSANEDLRKHWLVAIKHDVGQHFRVTSSTVVCGTHFTAEDFFTGTRQGSGAIKLKTRCLKSETVPFVFAWSKTVKNRPSPRERHLLTLPFEAKVTTCATKVGTLKAELAQTRKNLEHAEEDAACLRPKCYDLATF